MPVKLIVPFSSFYSAISGSKKFREDRSNEIAYRIAVGRFAFWYRDATFHKHLDGPQDQWWQRQISVLDPNEPKNKLWDSVRNVRRDHVAELKKTGSSSTAFAAAIHHMLHATLTRRAQRSAKVLDQLAFGEPASDQLGPICEFLEEDLHSADALQKENEGRSLIEISGLEWTQMPTNSSDRELSIDLTFDIFEQEIGGRYYVYGTKQASFRVSTYNFDVKKFYQSSRRELPEYITDNNQGRYTARGPKDDFGLLNGNAISDVICIVTPKSDAEAIVQIEAEVMRYNLDVKSINIATNRAEEETEEERINLINKLVCVLMNKRSLDGVDREIQICEASIGQ
ncbi:hypothetical protein [uncultured Roseobacter sp.]|uniref:hypothetical protein n=1 Tax=uncultured Roseobacter sp. TaxID=114847 RepID=UPI002630B075|nr:hypothetical protein [uncultured Roseobacter sp.]